MDSSVTPPVSPAPTSDAGEVGCDDSDNGDPDETPSAPRGPARALPCHPVQGNAARNSTSARSANEARYSLHSTIVFSHTTGPNNFRWASVDDRVAAKRSKASADPSAPVAEPNAPSGAERTRELDDPEGAADKADEDEPPKNIAARLEAKSSGATALFPPAPTAPLGACTPSTAGLDEEDSPRTSTHTRESVASRRASRWMRLTTRSSRMATTSFAHVVATSTFWVDDDRTSALCSRKNESSTQDSAAVEPSSTRTGDAISMH